MIRKQRCWKGSVIMAKVTTKEAIKLTAQYVGCSYKVADKIIKAYGYIVYKLLLEGYETRMPVLGRFYLATQKAQPEKEWKDPRTKQMITLAPKEAYQKPSFKFMPAIIKEVRQKTEGSLL